MKKYSEAIKRLEDLIIDATIHEANTSYEIMGKVEIITIEDIDFLHIVKEFEGALYIKVMSKVGDPVIIHNNLSDDEYLEFIEDISPLDGEVTDISVHLIKNNLLNKDIPELSKFNVIIYLKTDAFIKWFDSSSNIEDIFSQDKKTVVILLDELCFLENEYLAILGKPSTERVLESLKKGYLADGSFSKVIETRNINCNWVNGTKYLTPDFLYFENIGLISSTRITDLLHRKLITLIVPFLSSLTQNEETKTVAIINGYKTVKINLDSIPAACRTSHFFQLYHWIYESKTTDKLGILRNISSLYLKSDSEKNMELFCENIEDIFNSTKSSFEIYLKENVKIYFDQKKKLDEFIQSKVKEISQDISSVMDLMNKNLFTALGLIVGSMLSYVNNASKSVVLTALVFYVCLLIINTIFYGTYTFLSVTHAIKAFDDFILQVSKTMNETEVKNLVGDVIKNKKFLFFCFWKATILLSVGLLIASIYAIYDIDWILSLLPANPKKLS